MGVAGAAFGASTALEQILGEQMKAALLKQQQQERVQRLQLDRDTLAESQRQHQAGEARLNAAEALKEQEFQAKRAAEATDRNIGLDAANVMNMPGMTPEQQKNELMQSILRNPDSPKTRAMLGIVEKLSQAPKTYPVTVAGPNGKPLKKLVGEKEMQAGVEEYVAPKAPEKPDYEWVTNQDGVVRQVIKGHALPGEVPITAAGVQTGKQRQAADDRQAEGMRQYRSDMLDVVNKLIDENGRLKPDVAAVIGGGQGILPDGLFFSEGSQGALSSIDRLQGLLDLKKLGEMKSQSRTGATGFGQLSEKELAVLENAASTLRNRRQGEVSYASELKRIRDELSRAQGGPVNNPDISIGDPTAAAQALIDRARAGRKKP